jgi:hypothetical protein
MKKPPRGWNARGTSTNHVLKHPAPLPPSSLFAKSISYNEKGVTLERAFNV